MVMSAAPSMTRSIWAGGGARPILISPVTWPSVASSIIFTRPSSIPVLMGCVGGSQLEIVSVSAAKAIVPEQIANATPANNVLNFIPWSSLNPVVECTHFACATTIICIFMYSHNRWFVNIFFSTACRVTQGVANE